MGDTMQDYVRRLADLEIKIRQSAEFQAWEARKKAGKETAQAESALKGLPAYQAWAATKNEAENKSGKSRGEIQKRVDAEIARREGKIKAEKAEAARLQAEQAARSRDGLAATMIESEPIGPGWTPSPAKRQKLEELRAWASAELAAQIKSVEKNKVLGIPWGLKITLQNHDVLRVTERRFRHGATEAAVRLSAALSRELGWRGQALSGPPEWVGRTAVILAAEGVHVRGRTPKDDRVISAALISAGLANPPMPPRRPESARAAEKRERMTAEILSRWTAPAAPVRPAGPSAAPGTPVRPAAPVGPEPAA